MRNGLLGLCYGIFLVKKSFWKNSGFSYANQLWTISYLLYKMGPCLFAFIKHLYTYGILHFSRWFGVKNINFSTFLEWFEGENHWKKQLKKYTVICRKDFMFGGLNPDDGELKSWEMHRRIWRRREESRKRRGHHAVCSSVLHIYCKMTSECKCIIMLGVDLKSAPPAFARFLHWRDTPRVKC